MAKPIINLKEALPKIRQILKGYGMQEKDISKIEESLNAEYEKPPKIALIGFAGVGKSSTINSLFNAGREVSHVRACTREEAAIYGDMAEYTGSKGKIIIYDMPGLGEDIDRDEENYQVYRRVIPQVDVIVWTFTEGDRAMRAMQETLLSLAKEFGRVFTDHLVFAINKADIAAPGETAWNERLNSPSPKQLENIKEYEIYFKEKVSRVFPSWTGSIVSFSAKRRYNLDILMTSIVKAVDIKTRYKFGNIADVADFKDLIDPTYLEYIYKYMEDNHGRKS